MSEPMMSEERLKEMEKRANSATPGPWYTRSTGETFAGFSVESLIAATARSKFNRIYATPPGGSYPAADQNFIAHARTDIPDLLAEVRRLQAKVKELSGVPGSGGIGGGPTICGACGKVGASVHVGFFPDGSRAGWVCYGGCKPTEGNPASDGPTNP